MRSALIALAALTIPSHADAAVMRLADFSNGDYVSGLVFDGFTATVNSTVVGSNGMAMVFDTRTPSRADPDLNGPFTSVVGGDDLSVGNVLILSQDGNQSNPNDRRQGGYIELLFDTAVDFEGFTAFDMNKVGQLELELFDANGSLGTVSNVFAGPDASYELIDFAASDVVRALFTFDTTGAIGEFRFASMGGDNLATPVPPASLLLLSGLTFIIGRGITRNKRGRKKSYPRRLPVPH